MANTALRLLGACVLLAAQAGEAAHAETEGAETAPRKSSRLLPMPKGGPDGPPPVIVIGTAPVAKPETPREPERAPDPASNASIVEIARKCQQVVSPNFEINARILAAEGWGWTQPERQSGNIGSYESIQYMKGDFTIGLMDFGPFVICRAIATIEGPNQLDAIRTALKTEMKAVAFSDVTGMDEWKSGILRTNPAADLPNMFVAGNYTIELSTQTTDLAGIGMVGRPTLTMVMIESLPLPPRFQSKQSSATR